MLLSFDSVVVSGGVDIGSLFAPVLVCVSSRAGFHWVACVLGGSTSIFQPVMVSLPTMMSVCLAWIVSPR